MTQKLKTQDSKTYLTLNLDKNYWTSTHEVEYMESK